MILNPSKSIFKWCKKIYDGLTAIDSSPHHIAKSFAIGVFIGVVPFMGLSVALVVAVIFRLNKTAVALGALTNNPWTTGAIYLASFQIGRWALQNNIDIHWREILSWNGFGFKEWGPVLNIALVGGLIAGIVAATLGYALAYALVIFYQSRKKRIS